MFIVKLNKSVILTYVGVIFGVLSMYFAFSKVAFNTDGDYLRFSLVCLIIAGVCDMFDGKVARMCKRTKEEKNFGIQLDSLADTVNFLALPVVIMLSLGMTAWYEVLADVLLILCGVARLAFFNVHADMDNPVKFYCGLPVTSTAAIYPLLGLLHGNIADPTFMIVYLVATYLTAALMVLNIKVPKLKGIFYYIIPILSIVLVVLLMVIR